MGFPRFVYSSSPWWGDVTNEEKWRDLLKTVPLDTVLSAREGPVCKAYHHFGHYAEHVGERRLREWLILMTSPREFAHLLLPDPARRDLVDMIIANEAEENLRIDFDEDNKPFRAGTDAVEDVCKALLRVPDERLASITIEQLRKEFGMVTGASK